MSFDQIIINSCSPTFCNIKPANIFFVKKENFSQREFEVWKEAFRQEGLEVIASQISESSTAILILNICWVKDILSDLQVLTYLSKKGYKNISLQSFIGELFIRMKKQESFPHEVGVILGYPVEDVIEFERQAGHNCKYCGCWKSYSDVEKAKKCHCRFSECRRLCRKWYEEGFSINQIITKYQSLKKAA